jgi:hypothetical protein
MPMPDWVIKQVDAIGEHKGQGQTFRFLNQQKEPYKWTDEVLEDDTDFQGLLEDEEETVYPHVSTELPGVELEGKERDFTPVSDEPEADFKEPVAAALHNAGIDTEKQLQAAQEAASDAPVDVHWPAVIKANKDKIVYKITFDLPDTGLPAQCQSQLQMPLGNDRDDTTITPIVPVDTDAPDAPSQCYPTQARRSAVGSQPYNQFSPRVAFLQLGTTQVQGCITEASRHIKMPKGEQILGTTSSSLVKPLIDDTIHRADDAMTTTLEDELKVWGYLMTQYNLKPGLRKFGNKEEMAAVNKLTQLHVMDMWRPMYADKLSREQQMQALSLLLFLKEKRSRDIKGRACINDAPQWAYIPKDGAASPTVSTESTITASIAAKEQHKVQCYDVPSAFVNTDINEEVIMVLKGELAEMMIQIAPEVYRKYVSVVRKGTKILYMKLQKALYGLMWASLLFYWKLRTELEAYGFEINPYDPCVANKITEGGKQLTVIWNVDDLMGSCKDYFELTKFSCYLANIYGPKLRMHMGHKHDYLGVDMEFNKDGTLDMSMFNYLQDVIDGFPEVIKGRAATPAPHIYSK